MRCAIARPVQAVAVVVLLVFWGAAAWAQVAPRQSDIDAELAAARSDRSFAAEQRRKAGEWRGLAEQARRNAQGSLSAKDRNRWNLTAKERDIKAQEFEADAKRLEAKAAEKEAHAAELQKQLAAQTQAQERERALRERQAQGLQAQQGNESGGGGKKLTLGDALGFWRIDGDDSPFVIVQQDPDSVAYPYRLEAHTANRVWKGNYEPADEGDVARQFDARMTFTYKPTAEEMNPEIPLWARQEIAGKLEWKIEINEPQACGAEHLDLKWFPGEVSWREGDDGGSRKVWISGRGEPRELTLVPEEFEPTDAYVATTLSLRPPGFGRIRQDSSGDSALVPPEPIESLVFGQPFYIDVSVPYELAKKMGETITVNVRGLDGGGAESVELQRGALRKGRPVRYTEYRPFVIGGAPPFLSQSWFDRVGENKDTLGLDPGNGESIEFSYGDARQFVPIYKTAEDFFIARYLSAANRLRGVYTGVLALPTATRQEKESAHLRLQLLKNFYALLADEERPNWVKLAIAKRYVGSQSDALQIVSGNGKISMNGSGLVTMSDYARGQRIAMANDKLLFDSEGRLIFVPLQFRNDDERVGDRNPSGRFKGVFWTSPYEMVTTQRYLDDLWRERVKTALSNFSVNITKGLYDWTLSMAQISIGGFSIGVADIYALTAGTDPYGHHLSGKQKLQIVANVLLSNLVDYAKSQYFHQEGNRLLGYGAPGDRAITVRDAVEALRGRTVATKKVKLVAPEQAVPPDLPKTLSRRQKETAVPTLAEGDGIDLTRPVQCAAPPRAGPPAHPGPLDMPAHDVGDVNVVDARYGANASYDPAEPRSDYVQMFQTCNTGAILAAAKRDSNVELNNDVSVLRLMAENDVFDGKLRDIDRASHPFVHGYDEKEAAAFARLIGRETVELPSGKKLSLRALEHWRERGWAAKVVIHARDQKSSENLHAVDFIGVKREGEGCSSEVEIFDQDIGRKVTLPWEDLEDRMADYPVLLHRPEKGSSGAAETASTAPTRGTSTRAAPPRAGRGPRPAAPEPEEFNPLSDEGETGVPQIVKAAEEEIKALTAKRRTDDGLTSAEEARLTQARMTVSGYHDQIARAQAEAEFQHLQAAAPEFDFSRLPAPPRPQRTLVSGRSPRRQLIGGDAAYLASIMDGSHFEPTQNRVFASLIDGYVQTMLDGGFPQSQSGHGIELTLMGPRTTATREQILLAPGNYDLQIHEGHNRLIAAQIVARLDPSRQMFGGDNPIVPFDQVEIVHHSDRKFVRSATTWNRGVGVDP